MSMTLERVCEAMATEDVGQIYKFASRIARFYSHTGADMDALAAALGALAENGYNGPKTSQPDPDVAGPLIILFIETYLNIRPDHSSLIDAAIGYH